KTTGVIAQLELTNSSGEVNTINSDETWNWSNDGPIRFADLKDGENVDLRLKPSFINKCKVISPKVTLTSGNNTFIEEQEVFEPVRISKSNTGRQVFEFKQNLAGYFSLKFNAHKGDKVHITMGELLDNETGNVSLKNIQLPNNKRMTPMQEINITCIEGLNEYKGKFFIAGFRYLDIEGDIEVIELKQIALYSSVEETSSFECSNELINIFHKNTLWSLKSNIADVPTDCPTRERMGWTGDTQVFFNTAAYLTNFGAFARKHIVDVFDRQDKNGRLPQIAPYNAEDWFMNVMNGSVGWADVGILIPYRYYLIYGDDSLLVKYYDNIRKYIHFMIDRCGPAKGIYALYAKPLHLSKENRRYGINTGQSYGEWAEPNDIKPFVWTDFCEPHPEESMAYTSWMCDLMIKISNIVGKTDENDLYKEYRDGVKKAYQELVSKDRFSLQTTIRQAKLVRPLYLGLLTEEQSKLAKERLIKVIDDYGWRLGTGFLSTPFILDVLTDIDPTYAYRMLENEELPGWLYMAKVNTGTIWEGWEGPNSQAGIASLNHYSKGAMVEWLYRGMCGINIDGENHFLLKPIIGGKETYAKASYNSIYGEVALSWKKENDKIIIDIEVPSNTTASFIYKNNEILLDTGTYHFEY
ncbi:MAG: glycoside hydrolase family 78 protein, partial [Bacilli bacterium]|nr:glycoside hydrolase family 78 protein [Bacilli bacterium]